MATRSRIPTQAQDLIKHELGCENYVSMQLPKHLRSYIAQIRTGTLPLRIETGRFRKLKIEERLCPSV